MDGYNYLENNKLEIIVRKIIFQIIKMLKKKIRNSKIPENILRDYNFNGDKFMER